MKHFTKFYYFASLLICFLFSAQWSYADGSKDLYAAGVGGRAKLRSSTVVSQSYPFANLNTHYVYAVAGETITMASSSMGTAGARIKLRKPDGTLSSYSAGGFISNRAAEVAGPRLPGVVGGSYYTPITYTVQPGETGIYSIDFVPPAGESANSQTGRESSGILCTSNWSAPGSNDIMIAAWDVSIYNASNVLIPGRVYTTVLNLDIYNDFSTSRTYYGKMNVLTRDGYIYKVDNNGNNGISFEFFVNNNGFVNASGEPIYKSLNTTTGISGQIKDPRTADDVNSVTHKMFYQMPASDLPLSGTGTITSSGATGTTWLKNPRLVPKVTNLKVYGVEGTEGQISNKGGNIKFDANLSGRYQINITPVAPANFPTRTLTGFASAGANTVNWDGKDGLGNPLPAGNSPAILTIKLQGAEVHFPYFDMEINPNGIKLELLKADLVTVESDIVYWDDTNITLDGGPSATPTSNPINASQTAIPAGTSSSTNGHKWGNASSPSAGTFGDNKSMDTWTFVLGAEETLNTIIATKKSDLKVNSIIQNATQVSPNGNITYDVEVQNSDGTAAFSDVVGAPFAFNVPPGMEIVSVVPTSSCGGVTNNPVISADKQHFTALLDMVNGCKITYKIVTKATSIAPGPILVEATIMRPNDVNDPDATNPDPAVPPTDPHVECKNGTAVEACNNIKYNTTVTVIKPAITLVKSVTNTGTGTGTAGAFQVGDPINYSFVVKNTGDVPLTSISLTESLVGVVLSAKTGDVGNDNVLSVNEIWTYTGTYTVKAADETLGKVVNQATVTGTDPIGGTVTDLSGTAANNDTPTETPIQQTGKISLLKTGTYVDSNADGKVNVGDKITYAFKVTNTGNVTVKNIKITDPKVTVLGGPVDLAPGAVDNATFTASYTITQADVDAGRVDNIATAKGQDPKGTDVTGTSTNGNPVDPKTPVDPACPTCTITPLPASPSITLLKTGTYVDSNADGKVNVGDKITYAFKVTNTGNVTVKNIKITDPKVTVLGGPVDLAPGAVDNATFTASYTITQADVDAGRVDNIATAKGQDPKGTDVTGTSTNGNPVDPKTPVDPACPTCTITPLPASPSITLLKTGTYVDSNADGKVNVGDKITYTFKVTNTGNVTVKNIKITDPKVTVVGGPVDLAPGAVDNATFTASYTITQADVDAGRVDNIATAKGQDPKGTDVTGTSTNGNPVDPKTPVDPACPTCTITPLPQNPALSLTKTAVVGVHNKIGDVISYNLVLKNTGNVTVTAIAITDANADAGSISPALIASLAPNATVNITATHTIIQADLDRGYVTNIAKADGKDPKGGNVHTESTDPTPIPGAPVVPGCTDCTVTPVDQAPALSLTKTAVVGVHNKIGDVISYNLVLKNTGNVTVTAIAITDANADAGSISPALIASLAPNGTANITATHTVTQADLDRGYVTNIAKADGKDPKGGNVHAESTDPTPIPGAPVVPGCTDCTVTPIDQTPALSLTKTAVVGVHNKIGDVISYNLVLKNTGNVTVTAIAITDANADAGSISPALIASLAPNATANITAKHTVTQADLDRGYVTNIAKADGKDPKGGNVHAESTDPTPIPGAPVVPGCTDCTVTPIDQTPALSLTKTAVVGLHNKIGDVISYNLVLKNTGNVTVTAIAITDANADAGSISPALIASLAPNATANITAKHTVTQADLDRGYVTNIAKADGKDPKGGNVHAESTDPTPVPGAPVVPGCTDCTVTPVDQAPSLSLTKTAVAGTHNKAGDIIVYNLVVKNTGNVTVTAIAITDANADAGSITPALIASLAPNATVNITAKHTVTQADLDRGYVSNLAKADGKDPKGGNVHAESTDPNPIPGGPIDPACPKCTITPVEQKGAIALVKKVSNAGTGENGAFVLGNQIEYTFSITNTGNVSLKDLVLTDPLLNKPAISIPGILAPGQTVNHIEKYTITAADIAAGKVTNKAVINSTDPKGGNVKDESGTATDNDNPTVTVLAKPPVAKDDVKETQQNKPVIVEVQKNDEAGSSAIVPASTKIITQPKNGTVVVNADGTVTYTPNKGYTGTDEFTYTVTDKNGQISNPAKVTLTVLPTKPTAIDDSAETQWNTEVKIPVIGNDKTDGAPFDKGTLEITEQPKHGSVKVNSDGTVTYLPNSGYTGTDTFTYRVKDENGNWTNIATVTITTKGFFIPNVITPNGDGKNDTFVIVGLENYGNADVTIFNRWGNEVYRNNNYKNTWTGEGLNEGTYYYLIRLNNGGKTEVFKGWVLIKR